MNTVQIKRSSTPGKLPESLEVGEFALNSKDKRLFIGTDNSIVEVLTGQQAGAPYGLATLGQDSKVPYSQIPLAGSGSGRVLQTVVAPVVALSASTSIPLSNDLPTSLDGSQIWSCSITPMRLASRIQLTVYINLKVAVNEPVILSIFKGALCIGSTVLDATTSFNQFNLSVVDSNVGSTEPTGYSARIGSTLGTEWFCNDEFLLGGTLLSNGVATELA